MGVGIRSIVPLQQNSLTLLAPGCVSLHREEALESEPKIAPSYQVERCDCNSGPINSRRLAIAVE